MNSNLKLAMVLGAMGLSACATSNEAQKDTTPAPQPVAQPAPAPAKPAEPPPPPSTPDDPFRAQKPEPLATAPHFQAPVPTEKKLKNGVRVLINENHQVPLVVAEVVVLTGQDGNPISEPGLAEFHAAMLEEGTRKRSATEVAEQLENLAAQLTVTSSLDSTRIHLNALAETLPQALDLLSDITINPAFKQADVDRVKKAYLTDLAQRQTAPSFIASNVAARAVWGDKHPWGQPQGGTQAAVAKLGTKELSKFHDTYVVPQNALISISGDVKADDVMPLLEKAFGSWKGKAPAKPRLPEPPTVSRQILVVDHPGSQSRVTVSHLMLKATDPDVVPMKTANYVLGGLFTSRLNLNLREDKAYSYGVFSQLTFNDRAGVFSSSGNVVAPHTADAIGEMEKEYTRFSNGEVTPDELTAAKSAYVRSLPSQLETNDAVATSLGTLVVQGLPLDYYAQLPAKVSAVTDKDVARVAQKYVKPDSWPVVVVGPYAEQKEKLAALNLGEVKVVPAPGSEAMANVPVHGGAAADKKEPAKAEKSASGKATRKK